MKNLIHSQEAACLMGVVRKTVMLPPNMTVWGLAGSFWGIIPIPHLNFSCPVALSTMKSLMKGRPVLESCRAATFWPPKSGW